MPQTKIVFFDIDGTLIDMQAKKITPKMLETLHRLQDRGIKICIATGRSPMVLPKIDGVAFDAYLTFPKFTRYFSFIERINISIF